MKQQIGEKIQKLRLQQGLTQSQLAKGICDRSHISIIEANKCTPSILTLEKLADRLNITLSDLLCDVTPTLRESSFSFELFIEHIESILESKQYYEAGVLIRKHLKHPEIARSMSKLAQLHRYVGIVEVMKQDYKRAENYFLKAKEYAEGCRDRQILFDVMISLGALKSYLSNYNESESIYRNVLNYAPKEMPITKQTKLYYGLSLALQGQGKIKQAISILKSQLEQLFKNNSIFLFSEITALIASCYEEMNYHLEAVSYYKKVVAYHIFKGNRQKAALFYSIIANSYKDVGMEDDYRILRRLLADEHLPSPDTIPMEEKKFLYSRHAF